MKLGETYKILSSGCCYSELDPRGTIVKCVEDKGNGLFIVELIDNCGKKIEKGLWGWLVNIKTTYFELWKQQKN
jgi:hypothetical protein